MKISGLIAFTAVVAVTSATYQPVVGASPDDEDQFGTIENENTGAEGVVEVVEEAEEKHEAGHHGEHEEAEHHEDHGMFGIPWAAPDFLTGMLMGAYGPLNARNRGGDCFSQMYDWCLNIIELSNFFTKPFDIRSWRAWT